MDRGERKNNHLNLFNFYSDNNEQLIENNLTRALAICLENDPILFDRLLRKILGDEYDNLFVTVGDSADVNIGIQVNCSDFYGVTEVIGIPLSEDELILNEKAQAKGAYDPKTDLSIQIDEKLLIFEVKRNAVDCLEQLKNQLEKIVFYSDGDVEIKYYDKNFSWGILMDLFRHTLKFQSDVNIENLFSRDYYEFLKRNYPQWFGKVPFGEISFPKDLQKDTKQRELLEVRLNHAKHKMIELRNKETGRVDELVLSRENIPVPSYKWADEINIEPTQHNGEDYIAIKIWPGDTKEQGQYIYTNEEPFSWKSKIGKFDLVVQPQLKFAGRRGICWLKTKQTSDIKTHTASFFWKYTGRWNRADKHSEWKKRGVKWSDFDKMLQEVNVSDQDWKKTSEFEQKIQKSSRTVFNVSTGFAIHVLIPFERVKEIDGKHQTDVTPLAKELEDIIDELLQILNKQFSK